MEIKLENAQDAFNTADENTKKVLLALLPELKEEEAQRAANRPITERVKTFEDACRELGNDHPMVVAYHNANIPEVIDDNRDILAYMKLRIICAALNEGWQPEFTENEWRWHPWFTLWTEEKLSGTNDEWKSKRVILPIDDYSGAYAGFVSAISYNAPSNANPNFGSRLCLKSEALATYCGKQFISLWADFYLTENTDKKPENGSE